MVNFVGKDFLRKPGLDGGVFPLSGSAPDSPAGPSIPSKKKAGAMPGQLSEGSLSNARYHIRSEDGTGADWRRRGQRES
jgi:hypothetical protein